MNENDPFKGKKLEFPVHCHFKIITDDRAGIKEDLEKALLRVGVQSPLKAGNKSAKGTYITFNLDLLINSQVHMDEIDGAIRQVSGVKMVM